MDLVPSTLSPDLSWECPLFSPFLSPVQAFTSLCSHPGGGLCHGADPFPGLRTARLGLTDRSLPTPSLPSNLIPLGSKGLLETASPHLGRQPQTDSDSQPLLHGDGGRQTAEPANAAATQDEAGGDGVGSWVGGRRDGPRDVGGPRGPHERESRHRDHSSHVKSTCHRGGTAAQPHTCVRVTSSLQPGRAQAGDPQALPSAGYGRAFTGLGAGLGRHWSKLVSWGVAGTARVLSGAQLRPGQLRLDPFICEFACRSECVKGLSLQLVLHITVNLGSHNAVLQVTVLVRALSALSGLWLASWSS